ncbi:GtrA family protein [Xanthomonas sp. AmX2]|uniref:GtrA family protein n=1 Tax=Xanthomonas sp. TaxID=29446 RepID=UPI00197D2564|nr:GtrA family protein [Xanthomonas sp.]MBN6150371.1 GtrA family protein [Xanthomonas sp.]
MLNRTVQRYRQVLTFGLVGVVSSLTYLLVIALCASWLGWRNTPSVIVGYAVGTIVSYVGSGVFAFRRKMSGASLVKFLIVVGLSFGMNVLVSEVLSPMGVDAVMVGVVNVVLVGVFNFLCHKFWTFRE